uniref:helix-turn-helix domain-containing protein n=3 Tax=Collinsella aerofaciens TaxID=74426 RepID=UPI0034A2490B
QRRARGPVAVDHLPLGLGGLRRHDQHRMRGDERTLAYMAKRKSDGKTKREIMRCLKRFTAREVYPTLRRPMRLKYARGSILADMRKSLGLTQKQVARELNVPNVRLSEIEREVCPHEEIRREYDRYLNAKMSSDKGLDSL